MLNLHGTLDAQGNRTNETAFWEPDATGRLSRYTRGPEVMSLTPFPPFLVADQGCTECAFDEEIIAWDHKVYRPTELVRHSSDSTSDLHWPITAYILPASIRYGIPYIP